MTTKKAGEALELVRGSGNVLTRFQQADFARLREIHTGRFTVDRLIKIINALDDSVEVAVSVRPRKKKSYQAAASQLQ